jgi:hypothetical protein
MVATAALTPTSKPGPHVLTGSKITLVFANPGTGFSGTTSDRLDTLVWIDSAGRPSGNLAAHGGPVVCGDPIQFFGQSYGAPEGALPGMIAAGAFSTWTTKSDTAAKTSTEGKTCAGQLDGKTVTKYRVYTTSDRENAIRVTRRFDFSGGTPVFNGRGLRPYVPRLPLEAYPTVLWPNATGSALLTKDAGGCAADCEVTDWNGRWFADDNGAGSGMVVIRDSRSTGPALLAIHNDSLSASNLTAVLLIQPPNGWKAPLTETQYLCFYDSKTWPAADRARLKLPAGCRIS